MKRLALAGLALAATLNAAVTPHAAVTPQEYLDAELARAEAAWGERADVAAIRFAPLGGCKGAGEFRVGWSDLVKRVITINSECQWDTEMLRVVVTHEYGHMLIGSPAHSLDKRSVMYFQIRCGQQVTADDREWMRAAERRERPTLLTPAEVEGPKDNSNKGEK